MLFDTIYMIEGSKSVNPNINSGTSFPANGSAGAYNTANTMSIFYYS